MDGISKSEFNAKFDGLKELLEVQFTHVNERFETMGRQLELITKTNAEVIRDIGLIDKKANKAHDRIDAIEENQKQVKGYFRKFLYGVITAIGTAIGYALMKIKF